jgi:hypothetical protein
MAEQQIPNRQIIMNHVPYLEDFAQLEDGDVVSVYDTNQGQVDSIISSKTVFPVTQQLIVKVEGDKKVMHPITDSYQIRRDENKKFDVENRKHIKHRVVQTLQLEAYSE